jgi:RimJ/RimL family protein N-acetyltransferase
MWFGEADGMQLVLGVRQQIMIIAQTEPILLRGFHIADCDVMAEMFADPEVMRFGPGPQTREWVEEWLARCLEDYFQKWGFGLWAVVQKPERRLIGFCGLTRFDDIDGRTEVEISYRLARHSWGRGLATEAARAVRDYAFQVLTLPRLIAIIDPQNVASIRVAEKNAMRHEKDVLFCGRKQRLYAVERAECPGSSAASPSIGRDLTTR